MGLPGIHSDQKFIEGLLKNDHKVISHIYERCAPKVIGYIKKNSGDEAQARDVIQESLITIYDQAKTNGLQLTCPFDAYFFLVCKRRWFNTLKKKRPDGVTIQEEITSIDAEEQAQANETSLYNDRASLFNEMLASMGETCREIIKLSFTIKSMEAVAQKLGVSYGYVRKKKSICIGKLTKLVQDNPQYKHLKYL